MWRNISDLHQFMRRTPASVSDVKRLAMRNAEKIRPLNAIVANCCDGEDNKLISESSPSRVPPLHAVPVGVKDNFCVAGVPATCGSRMLKDFVPPYDASVVRLAVEKGGAFVLGKTNTDEFGMGSGCIDSVFGPTKSPWRSGLLEYTLQVDQIYGYTSR